MRTWRRRCRAACRTGTARRRLLRHSCQIAVTRSMSVCARHQILKPGSGLDVHQQRAAHGAEARMHLATDGPAAGARLGIGRQQAPLGLDLVEVFADGQRVPDLDAAMLAATAPASTTRAAASRPSSPGRPGEITFSLKSSPASSAHQPAAQRPGAVVLAADGENGFGHGVAPGGLVVGWTGARPVPQPIQPRHAGPQLAFTQPHAVPGLPKPERS